MKKLAFILLLLPSLLMAEDIITINLSVKATPVDTETVTINGSVRTWKDTVTALGTEIATTNSPANAATNLNLHLNSYPDDPFHTTTVNGTNVAILGFPGDAMVASITGTWADITYTTNDAGGVLDGMIVRVPYSIEASSNQLYVAYELVRYLNQSTNAFDGLQGTLLNLTNGTWWNGNWTDGYATNLSVENLSVPGNGSQSVKVGTASTAEGDQSVALGVIAESYGDGSIALGWGALVGVNYESGIAIGRDVSTSGTNGVGIGYLANVGGYRGVGIGYNARANGFHSVAIGPDSISGYDFSTVIGAYATATEDNQIMLGTGTNIVQVPGRLVPSGNGITNGTMTGRWTNSGSYATPANVITTLANGDNSLVLSDYVTYIRLSGSISTDSTLDGLTNGWEGRTLLVENDEGYDLTITDESGLEAFPRNRIVTPTGEDVDFPDDAFASFIYDDTADRWKLSWLYSASTNGGGGLSSVALDDLTDVETNNAGMTDGDVLTWDETTQMWTNAVAPGAAGGDSITVDSVAQVDPDFNDGGDIDFSAAANVITATIKADSVDPAHMADGDHGDFSIASNVATLDADVVGTAEMADADHGDISWSGGTASIDSGVIVNADINASAAIDATKIGNGTVTSTEFQYVGDVTSLIQAQLDGKQAFDSLLADIADLSDPGVDRILYWDDSTGDIVWLEVGSGLSISGTVLSATGGGGGEANYNGLADSTTNTTTDFGLIYGKLGVTNLLINLIEGDGHVDLSLANSSNLQFSVASTVTLDTEWDTSAEILAAVGDETGSGALVFGTSPTIVTPTIASFANSTHDHEDAAGGGTLAAAALPAAIIYSTEIDTSSELATIVTDETGSGALVFGTSPAFTTVITLPNGADAPSAVSTEGHLFWDSDDDALAGNDGSADVALPFIQSETFTIMEPDQVQPINDTVLLKHFNAETYPNGVTIKDLIVTASASNSDSYAFEEWSSTAKVSDIETGIAFSASTRVEDDGTLADSAMAADNYIMVNLPGTPTDIAYVAVTVTWTVNANN